MSKGISNADASSRSGRVYNRNVTPKSTITKGVAYVAGGSDSNQILSITQTDSSSAVTQATPQRVTIKNTGTIPVVALLGYESYSDEDTDAGTSYLQAFLLPDEEITPPMRGIIPTANHLRLVDGEVVQFTAPNTALKVDTGDNIASGELNNTDDPVVFELDNGHEKYRVGDYIRVENEICKVEGTNDDNPTTSVVADNHIVVSRGHFGSTKASHSGTPDVYWPVANEHYDFDRALQGSSQLVSSDGRGRFKTSNFYGYGRVDGDSSAFGITPGSCCWRFFSSPYQEISMGGTTSNIMINGATSSQLAVSTAYSVNLTLDDSSAVTISFTTDSSDVTFSNVVRKIQSAIDTATQTTGNGLYGYSCTVSIVGGRLRFTSNSHLIPHDGTNGSKVLLADAGSGTNLLSGSAGIFPDDAVMNAPVEPQLPDLNVYDPITYAKSMNMERVMYDDGRGNLLYNGTVVGSINYETGAHNFTIRQLPNANWQVSVLHNSPFSGKLDSGKADGNALTAIHANVLNKNKAGELEVKVY